MVHLQEGLRVAEKHHLPGRCAATTLSMMAKWYGEAKNFSKANDCLQKGLALVDKNSPADAEATSLLYAVMADLYHGQNQEEKAVGAREQSLHYTCLHTRPASVQRLIAYEALLGSYDILDRRAEAIVVATKALEGVHYNVQYVQVPHILVLLASAYNKTKRYQDCENLLAKPLARMAAESTETGTYHYLLVEIAIAKSHLGKFAEADALFANALTLLDKTPSDKDLPERAFTIMHRADNYRLARQFDRAEKSFLQALDLARKHHLPGVEHNAYERLSMLYTDMGRPGKAKEMLAKASMGKHGQPDKRKKP